VAIEADFRANERLLWGLGYRMTGTATDADELVQETFLRAVEAPPPDDGRPLRPWLVRVCTNLARDRLRRRRRAAVWLPEPVPTETVAPKDGPDARYSLRESATFGFLVALEALTPTQRAVLLLRDVFEQSPEEVAEALGSSPGAVRVAHHKARRALAAYDAARHEPDPGATMEVFAAFFGALAAGDAAVAVQMLAPEVVLRSDGGGVYQAAKVPVFGPEKVVKFLLAVSERPLEWRVEVRDYNGGPALVMEAAFDRGRLAPRAVVTATLDRQGRIRELHWLLAPDRLARVPAVG
jgi:RNA polymerase sigma-70 factor (ECF subfamily)